MKKSNEILRLTQMGVLAAISVVLVALVRIPIIPIAPFLVYDMADVPILIGTFLLGTVPGLMILLVVSVIQMLVFSTDGWIGLVMHFVASGVMVVLVGLFYKRRQKMRDAVIGMALGTIARTAVMIPMNLILTVEFLNQPRQVVMDMLLPAIIPFNLIIGGLNCLIAGLLFQAITPILKKTRQTVHPV
ncbi:MAG: ECF transporter S component [Clostridiales bacterium]|jgi:riboflavin transporter FmnP|nr:ECF transporter S component [Clostridiales bacterium]